MYCILLNKCSCLNKHAQLFLTSFGGMNPQKDVKMGDKRAKNVCETFIIFLWVPRINLGVYLHAGSVYSELYRIYASRRLANITLAAKGAVIFLSLLLSYV